MLLVLWNLFGFSFMCKSHFLVISTQTSLYVYDLRYFIYTIPADNMKREKGLPKDIRLLHFMSKSVNKCEL